MSRWAQRKSGVLPSVACTRRRGSRGRADARASVVLAHVEAEVAQVRRDPIGDLALLAGRARQSGELREEGDDVVVGHGPILDSAPCPVAAVAVVSGSGVMPPAHGLRG